MLSRLMLALEMATKSCSKEPLASQSQIVFRKGKLTKDESPKVKVTQS